MTQRTGRKAILFRRAGSTIDKSRIYITPIWVFSPPELCTRRRCRQGRAPRVKSAVSWISRGIISAKAARGGHTLFPLRKPTARALQISEGLVRLWDEYTRPYRSLRSPLSGCYAVP